ncbi:transmembrane protein 218 isoform X2 [Passer montanus]|uniref:transmembrane protein 218 isoform X2 n=1 Tax=Passer montanus TaxID=9160 RepID=UPI001961DBEB|nr:transmembrane protein 218 isoform X2 [Passer montanus]
MAGALGVGPGVLALLLLWAMALLLVTALGRAGRARLGAVPVVLGAAALTAALLLFPRESESPAPAGAEELSCRFLPCLSTKPSAVSGPESSPVFGSCCLSCTLSSPRAPWALSTQSFVAFRVLFPLFYY